MRRHIQNVQWTAASSKKHLGLTNELQKTPVQWCLSHFDYKVVTIDEETVTMNVKYADM